MGKLFDNGKGWHKESLRHREARLFGKASLGKSKNKNSKIITGNPSSSNSSVSSSRKNLVTMSRPGQKKITIQQKTKIWVAESKEWHEKTPIKEPIFVYGRHRHETRLTNDSRSFLTKSGAKVVLIPPEFQRFAGTGNLADRKKYDDFLQKTFKERHVVDIHSSSKFSGGTLVAFRRGKTLIGLELQPGEIGTNQSFRLRNLLNQLRRNPKALGVHSFKERTTKPQPNNPSANLKKKLPDKDKDGIPDKFDCQPNNPKKQDKQISQKEMRRALKENKKLRAKVKIAEKECQIAEKELKDLTGNKNKKSNGVKAGARIRRGLTKDLRFSDF